MVAVGTGAITPVVILFALELGASPALAGAMLSARWLGNMLFNLPAGSLVAKVGERTSMLLASGVLALAALAIGMRPSLPVFAALLFVLGCATAVWQLARLGYVMDVAPEEFRGRALATLSGIYRAGAFVGPLLGGLTIALIGLEGPFFLQALLAAVALLTLQIPSRVTVVAPRPTNKSSWKEALRGRTKSLLPIVLAISILGLVRSSRQVILPLWGDQIGIDPARISLIFAVASGIEMLVAYPAGLLMDRKGRKWAAIPCLALLSVVTALIPLTDGFLTLLVVGSLLGLANGMGPGINMVIASDMAPRDGRSQYLALWRFISDAGPTVGPLMVAVLLSVLSLPVATVAVGLFGFFGVGVFLFAVPETRHLREGRSGPPDHAEPGDSSADHYPPPP